jgi:GT2 family glycosyltransferase
MPEILVIFCFHNRRAKTEACIRSLLAQTGLAQEFQFRFLAFDDGSTDGTADALRKLDSSLQVLQGDGTWFWARSMAKLYQTSKEESFDFLLLVNDDVVFKPDAVHLALADQWSAMSLLSNSEFEPVVVGKIQDPVSGCWTYGGQCFRNPRFPIWFASGHPGDGLQRVHTFNANFLLIPRSTALSFSLDGRYSHAFADIDLGLHMTRRGVPIFQSSDFLGNCPRNPQQGSWLDRSLSLRTRLALINTRKGMPFLDRLRYARRNGGVFWPLFFLQPYVRFVLSLVTDFGKFRGPSAQMR